MKRLVLSALISLSMMTGVSASAATPGKFYVDHQPTITDQTSKLAHPFTDVTVITASPSPFYISITNSGLGDIYMQNGTPNIHIHSDSMYNVPMVLKNIYQQVFFSQYVCRLAIVTVYGVTGNQVAIVDPDLCN